MPRTETFGEISRKTEPQESIVWSVPDVFTGSSRKRRKCVTSPSFSLMGFTWRMIAKEADPYLGLFLWKLGGKSVIPEHEIELGVETYNVRVTRRSVVGKLDSYSRFGKWDLLQLRALNCFYFPTGFLEFFCEMRWIEKDDLSLQRVDRLVQDFKKMLLDGQNSDMILKIENREYPVHRNILSVRSPVFSSMLQHDMTEKSSGVVDIPDCSAEAFEVFLLYLYTGTADGMDQENVLNLYYAADKYSVLDLKKGCVEFMKNTLSVDTFCEVTTLSLQHGESELLKVATRFFCENVKKIIKTVRWQIYLEEHPTEANELYIKAVNA